jgi:uncharacterized protein YjbJ (UPF0337 family)
MERNADDTFGATGEQGSTGGSNSYGTSGAGMAGGGAPVGGFSTGNAPSDAGGQMGGQTGRTEQAKEKLQDKLGQVKDKARNLQSSLADRLDSGADKLRQRNQNATLAGATSSDASGAAGASAGLMSDERVANVQDSVARGMSKSADWLRNGDMKADIEKQVRENPGRTLLIALGVGYVLGKAFRGGNR